MVKLGEDVSYDGDLGAIVVAIDAKRPQDSNTQVGQQVYFVPESGVKLEQNMMRVTDTREVGGRRLVFVAGGPEAVPAWATHIAIIRRYDAEYINCTGSERALSMSLAYERGRKPWEWTRNTIDGGSPKAGRLALSLGKLRELTVDVLSAREQGTLTIDCVSCQTEEFADRRRFRIVIDLTVAGARTFRLAGTEMLGGDEMTLGGAPIADLPAGRVMAARFTRTLSYAPASGDPTIQVDMDWDRGSVRTLPA